MVFDRLARISPHRQFAMLAVSMFAVLLVSAAASIEPPPKDKVDTPPMVAAEPSPDAVLTAFYNTEFDEPKPKMTLESWAIEHYERLYRKKVTDNKAECKKLNNGTVPVYRGSAFHHEWAAPLLSLLRERLHRQFPSSSSRS